MTGAPLPYFCRLSSPTGYYEIAALEFEALTGDEARRAEPWDERDDPTDVPRIAWSRAGADVQRAAYVSECCHLLARAADLEGLLAAARKLNLKRERFRVRVRKLRGVDAPGSQGVERLVADTISGSPDLSRPVTHLVVVARPEGWLLGERVSRADRGWTGHEQRPHQYSSSLPPRLARALVNLVARPGERLLDPCCGVGTVLAEAAAIGIDACGWDDNARVVEHAAANLRHHGLSATLIAGDGRDARGRFHGAVVDLPYGRRSPRVAEVCAGLVARAVELCRHVAVVTIEDSEEVLKAAGARMLGVARITKGNLTRRVHWARGTGQPS